MANFPCSTRGSETQDPASPISNFSSEAPDSDIYFGRNYGPGTPPLLGPWVSYGCIGRCESTVSQEAADLCAAQQQVLCTFDNDNPSWPRWGPNPNPDQPGQPDYIPGPSTIYENTEQSADFTCPDGSIYTYTVPAGTFSAFTQASADNMALTWAMNKSVSTRICIGELSADSCCLGDDFEETVVFTLAGDLAIVTLSSGELPTGMTLDSDDVSFTISGSASGVGQYDFTIQVEDMDGNYNQKDFSIRVATIANTTLSDAEYGQPYSDTLMTTGPLSGSAQWSVVDGVLPDGLSLNPSTGVISGTPSSDGTFDFTIQMEDGA